jgi:hypothetical protein
MRVIRVHLQYLRYQQLELPGRWYRVQNFQSQVQITPPTPRSIFVEVTKMILTKVFCQLASHKRGSFSDLRFPGTTWVSLWISDFFPQLRRGGWS